MTFVQDNRTTSTLSADSRTSAVTMIQDNRTFSPTQGRIRSALLLPINLYNSKAGKPILILDTRN